MDDSLRDAAVSVNESLDEVPESHRAEQFREWKEWREWKAWNKWVREQSEHKVRVQYVMTVADRS